MSTGSGVIYPFYVIGGFASWGDGSPVEPLFGPKVGPKVGSTIVRRSADANLVTGDLSWYCSDRGLNVCVLLNGSCDYYT